MNTDKKSELKEEAKELYFQSDLTKTQIAEKVGITRKTLLFWSRQGNWDTLKRAAEHTPALVAEKCYYLIDQFTSRLLTDGMAISTLSLKEAQTIHLLASSVRKLKDRSTINESMEMFNFFLTGLNRRDPELAAQIKPQIEEFITTRANNKVNDYLLEGFNSDGSLPYPEKQLEELYQDRLTYQQMERDYEAFVASRDNNNHDDTSGQPITPTDSPQSPVPVTGYAERQAA